METKQHPAKYTDSILCYIKPYLFGRVFDPFAGTGKLRLVYPTAYLNELEPEWAVQGPATTIGSVLDLPYASEVFDCIVTSPCYGNRMADHHNAKDGSKRMTYTHTIGRKLHPQNSGSLQWGKKYREFHDVAWRECTRVLKPNGIFIVNVSDHIRGGKIVAVSDWHLRWFLDHGYEWIDCIKVDTPRMRRGANYDLRVGYENVFIFRRTS